MISAGAVATIVLRPEWLIDGVADVAFAPPRRRGRGRSDHGQTACRRSPRGGETRREPPGITLLPGLIDADLHYTIDGSRTNVDAIALGAIEPSERAVLIGARNARIALWSGVTTVRSAGASRGLDIPLAAAIEAGDVPSGPDAVPRRGP